MTAFATGAINVHAIIIYREFFYFLQLGLREQVAVSGLPYLSACGTDQMIVVFVSVCPLIFRHIPSKLMLHHQTAIQQQIDGIIESGSAHPEVLIYHGFIEGVHVKMTFR
jgi:hypothetical protein